MPKRHTIHYSSENAPQVEDDDNLFVYYCKYSGRHALTTDVSLDTLPVRRTDGARVLDTSQHMVRMYLADGGPKLIKRKNGKVERQYRLVLGHLPLAYKVEEDGKLVYILPDAVTVFADTDGAAATEGDKKEEPTPPCIARTPDGSSFVVMEVEDKAMKPAIVKINADEIRMHITSVITSPKANEELLEFFSKAIAMRLSQITLLKGQYTRRKHVLVKGLDPKTVYEKIQHAIDNGFGFETAVSRAPNYLQARRR